MCVVAELKVRVAVFDFYGVFHQELDVISSSYSF